MAGASAGHGLSGRANRVQNGPSVFAQGPAMSAPSAISRSKMSVLSCESGQCSVRKNRVHMFQPHSMFAAHPDA